MKRVLMLQYLGITLFLGCAVGAIFSVALWLLLPMAHAEGILTTAFFAVLATLGYFTFKYDYKEKEYQEANTTV